MFPKSVKAVEMAKKRKVLDSHLEVAVPETVYEELMTIVSKERRLL